jgi:hypothetical protein
VRKVYDYRHVHFLSLQQELDEHAQEGWRVHTLCGPAGAYFDVLFEKEVPADA